MKRLIKLKTYRNTFLYSESFLYKKAEWQQIQLTDPNLMQLITNCMTNGQTIQINYQGSGYRIIQPYKWYTSRLYKNGNGNNLLLYAYKDTGDIRSYRFDKILEIYIDNSLMQNNQQNNETQDTNELPEEQQTYFDNSPNNNNNETEEINNDTNDTNNISDNTNNEQIPYLQDNQNNQDITQFDNAYDDALKMLQQ